MAARAARAARRAGRGGAPVAGVGGDEGGPHSGGIGGGSNPAAAIHQREAQVPLSDLLQGGPQAISPARLDALAQALAARQAQTVAPASRWHASATVGASATDRSPAAAAPAATGPFLTKGAMRLFEVHFARMEKEDLPPADDGEAEEAAKAAPVSSAPRKAASQQARVAAAVAKYAPVVTRAGVNTHAGAGAGASAAPTGPTNLHDVPEHKATLTVSEHKMFGDVTRAEAEGVSLEWRGIDELRRKVAAEQAAYYEWERAVLTKDPAYARAADAVYTAAAHAWVAAADRVASGLPPTFAYYSEVELGSSPAGSEGASHAGAQVRRESHVSGAGRTPDLSAMDTFEEAKVRRKSLLTTAEEMGDLIARGDAAREACLDAVVGASGGAVGGTSKGAMKDAVVGVAEAGDDLTDGKGDLTKGPGLLGSDGDNGVGKHKGDRVGMGVGLAAAEGCAVVVAERALAVLLTEDKIGLRGAWELPIEVLCEPGAGEGPHAVLFEPLHPLVQGTREAEARAYAAAACAESAVCAAGGPAAPERDCSFSVWALDKRGEAGGRTMPARAAAKRQRASQTRTLLLVASPSTGLVARDGSIQSHVSVFAHAQHVPPGKGAEETSPSESVHMWVARNSWKGGKAAMVNVDARNGKVLRWNVQSEDERAACEARTLQAVVSAVLGLPRGRFVLSKAADSDRVYMLAAAGRHHHSKSGKAPYELRRVHAECAAAVAKRPNAVAPAEYVPLAWVRKHKGQIPRTFGMLLDKVNPYRAYTPSTLKEKKKRRM